MSHPAVEDLAAQTEAAVAHAAACAACARLLDEQRAMAGVLGGLPAPGLAKARREAMAAELMARADQVPAREVAPRRAWLTVAGGLAAAAAIVVVLALPRAERGDAPPAPSPISAAPDRARAVQREAPPPSPSVIELRPEPAVSGAGAFTRTGDVIALAAGDITVDARDAAPAKVVRGDTAIAVHDARVKIVTRRGVIAQVHVFAGSAQVTVGGNTIVVEQGVTWTRPEPALVAAASPKDRSLAAFRTGWEKLRGGDHAGAIAALDQATDEVVAEDAMYWAAVAAERAGRVDAKVRFERFVAAFPQSPRVDAARVAIERLGAN